MDVKSTESQVRVWTDFEDGCRRGSEKAVAIIITMIFLYMRLPHPMDKESREQSQSGKRTKLIPFIMVITIVSHTTKQLETFFFIQVYSFI